VNRLIVSAFSFAALAVIAPAQEALVFKQHYKVGQRYHQTMSVKQEMDLELGAEKHTRETATTMGMLATATAHENGRSKRVSVKYDRVLASVSADGHKYSFDSAAPEGTANAGPLLAYGRVVGQEFKVVFDEKEEVTEVENLEAVLEKLSAGDPAGKDMFQQLFSRDAVKRMMQQSALRSPPGKPIAPGGNWPFSQELAMPGIGKLKIAGFYTYKGMVDRGGVQCAEVKAVAEIKLDRSLEAGTEDEALNRMRQMQLNIEDGKMEGTIYYDPVIEFTRDVEETHRITLTGKIPDGSGKRMRLPMRQTIGVKLDSFEAAK
jgi:Family of unknown function (DUF6263)